MISVSKLSPSGCYSFVSKWSSTPPARNWKSSILSSHAELANSQIARRRCLSLSQPDDPVKSPAVVGLLPDDPEDPLYWPSGRKLEDFIEESKGILMMEEQTLP